VRYLLALFCVTVIVLPLGTVLVCAGGPGLPPQPGITSLVFVANGSGDQHYVSDGLFQIANEKHLPLYVQSVDWSRTKICTLDLHDKPGQKQAAERLTAAILQARASHPQTPIHLVGHSAGAHVVLAASEGLPEGSIQRIVLLAAAVSRHYDLRPALHAACLGIDSYYSKTDCTLLAVDTVCLTADGHKALTAGRVGFAPPSPEDPLYAKLRQYPYSSYMKTVGHYGGHYGWTRQPFLLQFVVPLLTGVPAPG
jgi:pimeloyl-ACP methyl ester carboxylesterase